MAGHKLGIASRAGALVWRSIATPPRVQTRWFSCSAAFKASHVISFPERTSNPELDANLAQISDQIILPSYLTFDQRKQLYNAKYKDALQSDPITMEIDGNVLRFRHINRFTLPNTQKIFYDTLRKMKTAEDLELLPRLLEGVFTDAGRNLAPPMMTAMIMSTQRQGCLYVVRDCIRAAKRTQFRLTRNAVVHSFLTAVQKDVVESNFEKEKTEKMLVWAQQIIELLENRVHKPTDKERVTWEKGFPLNRDPLILATRLHLAAALALKHQDGVDVENKVTKLADELVKIWPAKAGLLDLYEKAAYVDSRRMRYIHDLRKRLWHGSPILNGLQWASQVVTDEAIAAKLRVISAAVEKDVESAHEKLVAIHGAEKTLSMESFQMYNSLFGEESDIPRTKSEEQAPTES